MQQDMQEKRTKEVVKQVYAKPLLGRMSLVADRVLSYCNSDISCDNQTPAYALVVDAS
jgi:hypothetical protein